MGSNRGTSRKRSAASSTAAQRLEQAVFRQFLLTLLTLAGPPFVFTYAPALAAARRLLGCG
jgi:hypothetical protein